MHAKSQAKGRGLVCVAALVGCLGLGVPGAARAQLDVGRLPPLPPAPELIDLSEIETILGILSSVVQCVPQSVQCRSGFDCCDPCAGRADGAYCGDEVFPPDDSQNRYFCEGGQTAGVAFCSQGCEDGRCVDPGGGVTPPL
jgi:hypothetical protein